MINLADASIRNAKTSIIHEVFYSFYTGLFWYIFGFFIILLIPIYNLSNSKTGSPLIVAIILGLIIAFYIKVIWDKNIKKRLLSPIEQFSKRQPFAPIYTVTDKTIYAGFDLENNILIVNALRLEAPAVFDLAEVTYMEVERKGSQCFLKIFTTEPSLNTILFRIPTDSYNPWAARIKHIFH